MFVGVGMRRGYTPVGMLNVLTHIDNIYTRPTCNLLRKATEPDGSLQIAVTLTDMKGSPGSNTWKQCPKRIATTKISLGLLHVLTHDGLQISGQLGIVGLLRES